jgi:hypothetical protein
MNNDLAGFVSFIMILIIIIMFIIKFNQLDADIKILQDQIDKINQK